MGRFKQFIILTLVQVCLVGLSWGEPLNPEEQKRLDEAISLMSKNEDKEAVQSLKCGLYLYRKQEGYKSDSECRKATIKQDEDPKSKVCNDAYKDFTTAANEFNTECGKSGLQSCNRETLSDCQEKSSENEYANTNALLGSFGVPSLPALNKKCSGMTFDKWQTQSDKLSDKLSSAKDKLVEAQEKVQSAQKAYNEKNIELSKAYNQLNKDEAKRQLELKSAKREAVLKNQEAIKKLQDAQFGNSMQIQDLRQQIESLNIEKTAKLAAASAAIAKFQCSKQVSDALKKMGTTTASNFSSMMQGGTTSRTSSNAVYQECITNFLAGRESQIQQYEAKIQALNSKITNLEENGKYLSDTLTTTKSQTAEINSDMEKADQDALKNYTDQVKEIQTQMTNNYNESTQKLAILNANQSRLDQEVNQYSNKFLLHENKAPDESATGTYKNPLYVYSRMESARDNARAQCGNCEKDSESLKRSGLCKSVDKPIKNDPIDTSGADSK